MACSKVVLAAIPKSYTSQASEPNRAKATKQRPTMKTMTDTIDSADAKSRPEQL